MSGEKPTTANFLSGMLGAVPPLNELFKMNGMELPSYLGKVEDGANKPQEVKYTTMPKSEKKTK